MPEKITLSTQLVNAVLQFLAGQPYQSVAGLISQIQEEAKRHSQETSGGEPDKVD